ncbi:MAG TPA: hypothetical protein VG318_12760 [Actinomycetota bacterium]|nr:hypothetical protein [Actinomycetota bacterium]
MDSYGRGFLFLLAAGMFVVGAVVGRLGRAGTWRAGILLGASVAVVTIVVGWRSFRK